MRRIDRAAIHAHAHRTVVLAGHVGQEPDLVLPRLAALVMIQMARVVADLVDVRGDVAGQAIVLLQVDRQIGLGLAADFGQRRGVLAAVDGDPHHVGAGGRQVVRPGHRGLDVLGVRGRHALHGDRMIGADHGGADPHGTGWIALQFHRYPLRFVTVRCRWLADIQSANCSVPLMAAGSRHMCRLQQVIRLVHVFFRGHEFALSKFAFRPTCR